MKTLKKILKNYYKSLMKKIQIGIIGWGPVSRYRHFKAINQIPN